MSPDRWVVRGYLVILPCLWWKGLSQAEAQTVAWQVATIGMVAWACWRCCMRPWASRQVGAVMVGAVLSGLCHWPAQGYPMLILLALLAWATVWSLIQLSPSTQWIEQSVVWLALVNVGYAVSQQMGYDPLFATHQLTGLMGRSNLLTVLWLVALPLAKRWQQAILLVAIVLLPKWTALLGAGCFLMALAWQRWPAFRHRLVVLSGLLCAWIVVWWVGHPGLWPMKVLPRLWTWQETFGQALWSPLWGYGLGMRPALSTVGAHGDLGYNIWLEAFHAGGFLVLAPVLWVIWSIWRSPSSSIRTALLLVAFAGCTQSLWHTTSFLIVTLALFAAWELRRVNAV